MSPETGLTVSLYTKQQHWLVCLFFTASRTSFSNFSSGELGAAIGDPGEVRSSWRQIGINKS